jgi:short-subunit dehydrogenase
MEIKGSHILITGANRGIGRAVALACAEDQAHLHLAMRKEEEGLKDEMIKAGARSVTIYEVDLSDRRHIERFLASLKGTDIDILFNNAGRLTGGLFEEQSLDEIYEMLQVNINALIHLTHALLPGMLQRKRGKIINHSSVSGVMHMPAASTYSASKAAVLAFTSCLRAELKNTPVTTLTLITPGVDTRMFRDIPNKYGKNFDLGFLTSIPAKKYAQMIREAILEDLDELKPSGLTGAGLFMAQHLPGVFENLILKRFKRD